MLSSNTGKVYLGKRLWLWSSGLMSLVTAKLIITTTSHYLTLELINIKLEVTQSPDHNLYLIHCFERVKDYESSSKIQDPFGQRKEMPCQSPPLLRANLKLGTTPTFLGIYQELRDMIYEEVVTFTGGKLLLPFVLSDRPVLKDYCAKTTLMRKEHTKFWLTALRLASTCKQIRFEARDRFYKTNDFCLDGLHYSTLFIPGHKEPFLRTSQVGAEGIDTYLDKDCDECWDLAYNINSSRLLACEYSLQEMNLWIKNTKNHPVGLIQLVPRWIKVSCSTQIVVFAMQILWGHIEVAQEPNEFHDEISSWLRPALDEVFGNSAKWIGGERLLVSPYVCNGDLSESIVTGKGRSVWCHGAGWRTYTWNHSF